MTKQEYEEMMRLLHPYFNKATQEYIESLIESLEAEYAKLEKQTIEVLEHLSEYACPSGRNNNYGQPCNDSDDCVACWREYLRGKDE